jgi:putative DNA primase/helicase
MQLNVNNIPKVLKDLNIWLCYDDRDKDYFKELSDAEVNQERKAPRDLKGNKCSIKKHFSLNECLDSIDKGFNSGVGLALNNNGIVCIDYDNCISSSYIDDKLGLKLPILKEDVKDRINKDIVLLNSYTEISPSGKGIHIYLMANSNIKVNINRQDIEIYTNHFIRFSGNLYNPIILNELSDSTDRLEQLLDNYNIEFGKDELGKKSIINTKYNAYKDLLSNKFRYTNKYNIRDIKDTMFNSKKGKLLKKLYDNTITDDEFLKLKGKKDASDVDLSDSGKSITLIMHLLHFSYGDIQAVYKIFISSALCKDKYLKKAYANHTEDIIKNQFIPYAIINYYNYSDKE